MANGLDLFNCQRCGQIFRIDDDVVIAECMIFGESETHGQRIAFRAESAKQIQKLPGHFRNEPAKSSAAALTTFFSSFDSAINWFSFFSQAAPSIGSSTVWPSSD